MLVLHVFISCALQENIKVDIAMNIGLDRSAEPGAQTETTVGWFLYTSSMRVSDVYLSIEYC